MPVPVDRLWTQHAPGDIREAILVAFRNSLRTLNDPVTGQPHSEETIRRATMRRTRYYVEANSIDIIGLGIQRRDEFLAQQIDPRRASSTFLNDFHANAWQVPQLSATGGSGFATVTGAAPGTVYIGSTVVPDPNLFATTARDEAANTYQVFFDVTVPSNGNATLTFVGISTGTTTNLVAGSKLTFDNPPPGSPPFCTVLADFSGGTERETDAEWGQRIFDSIGTRAAAGNPAHFREWARRASNAVLDAYVYPCALHAGSVVVAITQKRGGVVGPNARVPSLGTLNVVGGYLTPPTSPVVPGRAHIVLTGWTPETSNVVMQLGMRKGSQSGWADATPWPAYTSTIATVQAAPAPSQAGFRVNSDTALPATGTPQLMIWNDATSAFELLSVATIVAAGGGLYDVTLSPNHSGKTITAGDYISPYSARRTEIGGAVVTYFDDLGLGEVVDLTTDMRAARAYRRPRPDQANSLYAGSNILSYIEDVLGGSVYHRVLASISKTTPTLPTTISTGPNGLVPGKIAIYAL